MAHFTSRRAALRQFLAFVASSPLATRELRADRPYSAKVDPLLVPANVFDFADLAKAKLDPLAWDYVAEGSEDEASLRDNREKFEELIIRPHPLDHDTRKIDISTTLFGKTLAHPIFLCPTGGKNCVFPNGERETAIGAGASNTMQITSGGIEDVLRAEKGPRIWWQFTTAAEFVPGGAAQNKIADYGRRLADNGCTGISVTVDIYHVSHREHSIHNGLVRSWCNTNGIPRGPDKKVLYRPDDILWSTGEFPLAMRNSTPTWDTLQRLHDGAKLPVIVKGILTAEDTGRR